MHTLFVLGRPTAWAIRSAYRRSFHESLSCREQDALAEDMLLRVKLCFYQNEPSSHMPLGRTVSARFAPDFSLLGLEPDVRLK